MGRKREVREKKLKASGVWPSKGVADALADLDYDPEERASVLLDSSRRHRMKYRDAVGIVTKADPQVLEAIRLILDNHNESGAAAVLWHLTETAGSE